MIVRMTISRSKTVCGSPAHLKMSSIDLPTKHHGDPGKAKKKQGLPLQTYFRSYAGMTRIRFKGPAHRHLSIVRCPPRNTRQIC
jgi:hypothetical protein